METAILSPDGRICKTYTGNEWKPADVLADLKSCAAASETSKTTGRSLQLGEPAVVRKQA